MVGAAAGRLADRVDRVVAGRRARRSRRARGASSSFAGTTSTATIVPGPGSDGAEQRREPDAAEPEDGDALARARSAPR